MLRNSFKYLFSKVCLRMELYHKIIRNTQKSYVFFCNKKMY